MVAVAVASRRRDQAGEAVEELKWSQAERGAAVPGRARQVVEPLPILPLQVVWLGLVASVLPSLALAGEPNRPESMEAPPRRTGGRGLSRAEMREASGLAAALGVPAMVAFGAALGFGADERVAVTLAFVTLALSQLLQVGNVRLGSMGLRFGRAEGNPWLLRSFGLGVVLLLVAVYMGPLARALGTVALGPLEWGLALGATMASVLATRVLGGQEMRGRVSGLGQRARATSREIEEAPARSVLLFDDPPAPRRRGGAVSPGLDDPWPIARAAVQSGDLERLRALIRWYPKLVHARDDDGTLLHHATGMPTLSWSPGGPELVTALVEAGADPDAGERLDGSGETPLIQAVSLNNTPVAERLLELGAQLEGHGRYPGQGIDTALGYALLYSRDPWFGFERGDCVELLLDRGALASLPLKAALGRTEAVVEMLPGASAEEQARALVFAAHRGETEVVRACLDAGVDASRLISFFHERLTPLLAAAGQGHLETVQVLMDAGVEPEWPEDRLGTNAMVWAWTRSGEGSGVGAERGRKGSGVKS